MVMESQVAVQSLTMKNQAIEDTIPEVYDMLETNPGSHFPVDNDLFSIMQSPVNIELPPFTDVPDECNSSQFVNNAYEQELDLTDEFLNSILVEQDDYTTAEILYCLVNDSPTLESQRKLYYDDGGLSSDADTESIVARRAYMEGEYVGSTEYRQMKMVAGSDSAARADTQLSFNHISGREKKESIFYNNFLGFDTSSGESAEDRHFEINLLEIASEDSTVSVPTADTHFEINSIQVDSEESPVSVPTANTHFGINCIQVADVESPITVRKPQRSESSNTNQLSIKETCHKIKNPNAEEGFTQCRIP
ncbi:NAC domain-containing protein 69 [Quillaja saponaria]|uniref:NAC domain-containing protein 69 n=1 Tax=Quillaja saponaria TaxID=32244 RepID=A0AAD7LSM8_QUISA|nr:NAC domain-containing protein 69 [Quillaja saponaria]